MSTPAIDHAALDNALNQRILAGDILGAFEEFYAENVSMQENNAEPFVGKDVNRKREQDFVASIDTFHGGSLVSSAYNPESKTSFSEWLWDVTFKGGSRVKMEQVAVRRWDNGKVVFERFYYKG